MMPDDDNRFTSDQIIFVERPRCPRCGGDDLETKRSTQQGDGSVLRRVWCRDCPAKFYVVVE